MRARWQRPPPAAHSQTSCATAAWSVYCLSLGTNIHRQRRAIHDVCDDYFAAAKLLSLRLQVLLQPVRYIKTINHSEGEKHNCED